MGGGKIGRIWELLTLLQRSTVWLLNALSRLEQIHPGHINQSGWPLYLLIKPFIFSVSIGLNI